MKKVELIRWKRKLYLKIINPIGKQKKAENCDMKGVKVMEKESSFFETNLKPFVEEIENASQALNTLCEDIDEGMCFLLKDTLNRIAKDLNEKIDYWKNEFVVYKKTENE